MISRSLVVPSTILCLLFALGLRPCAAESADYASVPLRRLDLPVDTRMALRATGIETFGDIVEIYRRGGAFGLSQLPRIRVARVAEIMSLSEFKMMERDIRALSTFQLSEYTILKLSKVGLNTVDQLCAAFNANGPAALFRVNRLGDPGRREVERLIRKGRIKLTGRMSAENEPLWNFELSERSKNGLLAHDVFTMVELLALHKKDGIRKIPGMGDISIAEITALARSRQGCAAGLEAVAAAGIDRAE